MGLQKWGFAMHRPTVVLIALLTSVTSASAADARLPVKKAPPMAPPPVVDIWNGFYFGGNVGGGWANAGMEFGLDGAPPFASIDNSLRGLLGGVQAGFNWQAGPTVFGIEADYQWTDMKCTLDAPCPPGICAGVAASFTQKMPWFATARARFGFADAGFLIYVTGGYAFAKLEAEASATAGGVTTTVDRDQNRTGWTLGGGIEAALTAGWTAKTEYLYIDAGDQKLTANGQLNFDNRFHVFRFGLNRKFGS